MRKISTLNITLIIIASVLLLYVLSKPFLYLLKVIFRSGIWSAAVYAINIITASAGFTMGINPLTSLIYGILGIYGVAASYIIKLIIS